ncbi:MAG: fibrinogen-like YCDxxxxGGGW domain-containing protein [Candidatus Absconditabacteria bacterium]
MANKFKRFLKSFTLIELIIVIAIIAVLGASAFLMLSQWMSKSRDSRKIADLGTIDTAINISITSNDNIPKPDNLTKVMFSGNRIWDVGYFGDEAVKQIGGSLTKSPIDPTTKERYRYAQWNNKKYQLGTIIENQQFSKYTNRVYANEYFTRLQGNYNQSIIVASIDGVDTILPVPSLIVDKYEGEEKILGEEHFWTNKGTYNLGGNQTTKLKVESLYSGDLSKLSDTTSTEFTQFISNYEKVYTGTNFVSVLNNNQSENEIKVAIAQELSKVSSQPVSVLFLTCEGYNHGTKVDFYKQESVGFGDSCDSIKSQFECKNGVWEGEETKSEYTKTSCNAQLPAQCDGNNHGTVKDFFNADSVAFGQSCETNKKSFSCDNGTWKDGSNNADVATYQYTSCVVGNPVDCNATNIVKKSVTNLDITFDVSLTQHGQSFEKAKTITENNGSYEYTLVGDCSNGTYQEVTLSDPVNKGCNEGYYHDGNNCILVNYFQGGGTNGNPWFKSDGTMLTSCKEYNLGSNTLNNGTLRGNGTCGDGTKACLSSGIYKIDPDGGSTSNSFEVYCNMTTDGGGWTLVHKTTSSTTDLAGSLNTTEGTPDWDSANEYRLTIDYWKGLSTEKAMAMNIRIDGVSWNDIQTGYITAISTSGVTYSQTDTYRLFNFGTQGYGQNNCTSGTYYWNESCCARCVNYDNTSSYGSPISSPMVNTSSVSYVGSALEGGGGTHDSTRHRLSKMGIFLR